MATNLIQGENAVLSIMKGSGFVPYLCGEEIQIEIDSTLAGKKTVGDGVWKKFAYQDLSFTITISGLLKFDDVNFSGWDFVQNQAGFVEITFLCSFTDDAGNIKSIQGNALITKTAFDISVSNLVKNDIELQGSGAAMIFDGAVPCPGIINTVTPTGLTNASGNVNFAYTYSGPINQIKYQVDGVGAWVTIGVGSSFNIPVANFSIGNHFIAMTPVCSNGYEGVTVITNFAITLSLTCTAAVTSITSVTVTGSSVQIQVNLNTSPGGLAFNYRLNGGPWQPYSGPITTGSNFIVLSFNNLAPASYSLDIQPVCANGVPGTLGNTTFVISSTNVYATINWAFNQSALHGDFIINVNGATRVHALATGAQSGSIQVLSTDLVYMAARPYANNPPFSSSNEVEDTTTTTVLYNMTLVGVGNGFTFTPGNGDSYSVTASIT